MDSEPIVLRDEQLAYWFHASGLINALAETEGITAENLGEEGQSLTITPDLIRSPGGARDWRFFKDLVEGRTVFAMNARERKDPATVGRRAARAASVHNILTREALINNIDFDGSLCYSRELALTFMDYLMYKTPGTMLTGLFEDFGSPPPARSALSATSRAPRLGPGAVPLPVRGHTQNRYNNYVEPEHNYNNNYNNNNNNNFARARQGNREYRQEQLGRHGAQKAVSKALNYGDNNDEWNGPRPGKGKGKRWGGRKTRRARRSTRRGTRKA
jgi:hypothetical protein